MIALRPLGRTGLRVSSIGFGTVSLGIDYGIGAPGQFGRPPDEESMAVLRRALARGVTLFDTAPAYGESERLLGALGGSAIVATKVTIGSNISASIDRSLALLGKSRLDVVQIHNATVEVLRSGALLDELEDCRTRGKLSFLGASVYTEEEALAAIDSGRIDVLQVAYNLLDQRMAARVFPAARSAGVGVIARSALLKGALTAKAAHLPEALAPLREAAERARVALQVGWDEMPQMALRFCLAHPDISTVLIGARTSDELDAACTAAEAGPLSRTTATEALALSDDALLNPAKWPPL